MHADVSPSVFIVSGINLESEQYVLLANLILILICSFFMTRHHLKVYCEKQGRHPTDTQLGTIQRLQNALKHKIDTWRRLQMLYTPAAQLMEFGAKLPTSDVIKSENSQLWLPSALCHKHKHCNERLLATEWDLQHAQAGGALKEIRQSLHLWDYMYTFKRDWIHGQIANTRAQNTLSRVESRAMAAADKYHAARAALSDLAHVLQKVGQEHIYKVLDKKTDVCRMSVPKRRSKTNIMDLVGRRHRG